jgi:hypothetical protein
MAQELNLIEKSPLFHNPYVFKEDQQVKMIIKTSLSSFFVSFYIEKTTCIRRKSSRTSTKEKIQRKN